jgi:hypothetical protein
MMLLTAEQGLDILMRYFVGTELGVANHIQRQFDVSTPVRVWTTLYLLAFPIHVC